MTVRILVGDVHQRLAEIPDNSVDCIVCSPPYWGLRDYDVADQIGLEATLAVAERVLRRVMPPNSR